MKVSPIAQGSGQTLGSVDVGRTADPIKMERARAIARGEKIQEAPVQEEEKPKQNTRNIKMRTQQSVYREEAPQHIEETAVSSNPLSNEQATVEATQPLSPQFAALAKQKRALQVKERELSDREKALSAGAVKDGSPDLIARLKSQPLSVLQEYGVTYDQLTEAILADPSNQELQELKNKVKSLEEGIEQKFISREEQAEEAALTEMLYEAEGLAKEGDAFEMIRERNAYDRVLRLIHETYKKTGRVLDTQDAMNRIEIKLLEEAEKLARIKKVQSRIAPPSIPPLQPQQRQMRTLTARDTAAPVMDRKARAIAAMNGTLRK